MQKFNKVIIWGYPLYSHTHSFIHYGWHKAFKSLGYDTYWFSDDNFPENFDFSNSLFIAEGCADKKIPKDPSSTYAVHVCREPGKYLNVGARLIDIRFNVKKTKDYTYNYSQEGRNLEKIDAFTLYEKSTSDDALTESLRNGISGYEALYMIWATDVLPDEFNFDDVFIPRKKLVHHIGSVWSANQKELLEFKKSLDVKNIEFVVHDPWKKMTSNEEAKQLVQESFIAPDIRGSGLTCSGATKEECNHLTIGYIPCRVFKHISYGQLGITNSPAVHSLMPEHVIFSENPGDLLDASIPYIQNFEKMQDAMRYVQANHTYINRVNCLLEILK